MPASEPPPVRSEASAPGLSRLLEVVAGLVLLAAVSTGAAVLVTPGLFGSRVPVEGSAVGDIAGFTIKADRDYDLPDEATTAAQRDEASGGVRPVYDYDTSIAQGALSRVRAGFSRMQEAILAQRARTPALTDAAGASPGKPKRSRKDDAPPPELVRAMEDEREGFFRELQLALDEEDLRALESAQFSSEVEQEVEQLLRLAQTRVVATAADELLALGRRGIAVRTFPSPGPREAERVLLGAGQTLQPGEQGFSGGPGQVSEVADLDHVRAELEGAQAELTSTQPQPVRRATLHLARRLLRPNLTFNAMETAHRQELARVAVKPVVVQLKRGDRVITAGERIDKRHALVFAGMRAQNAEQEPLQTRAGAALVIALLLGALFVGGKRALRRFRPSRKDALLLGAWLLAMLALVDASGLMAEALRDRLPAITGEALQYAVPFAAGAMLLRLVLGAEAALLFSGVFALLSALAQGGAVGAGLYAWVGALLGAQRIAGAKDRGAIFRAGVWAGVANAGVALGLQLLAGKVQARETIAAMGAAFLGGAVLSPIVVLSVAPLVEWLGGYVTDLKLLELANLNHPALKELIVQAPGTYHHSIIMGSLVESAAAAIGANPLLARVCAYFHDIGKGRNPLYFGENQKGENRHDRLPPKESARLIHQHVIEGLAMAKQYRLPRAVADAIPQHHGTRLVGYFFHKALKESEGRDVPPPLESDFRYPGPKPQYPEAALVMIADAVEAASRALPEPTDANLQVLVKKIINGVFADGQLDACDLTLKDLNVLAQSFYATLSGIYHTRPQYPPGAMSPPRREEPTPLRAVGDPSPPKKLGT
jgi:putative nucleotidyltransferase with HDIG domain